MKRVGKHELVVSIFRSLEEEINDGWINDWPFRVCFIFEIGGFATHKIPFEPFREYGVSFYIVPSNELINYQIPLSEIVVQIALLQALCVIRLIRYGIIGKIDMAREVSYVNGVLMGRDPNWRVGSSDRKMQNLPGRILTLDAIRELVKDIFGTEPTLNFPYEEVVNERIKSFLRQGLS